MTVIDRCHDLVFARALDTVNQRRWMGQRFVLNWLDFVIIAIVAVSVIHAWRTGFVRGAVGLLAVAVGVFLAGAYHERVILDLAIATEPTAEMKVASFGVILAVVVLAGWIAGNFLKGAAEVLMLGWADRSAGAVFGLLFAVLLVQAAMAIVVVAPIEATHETVADSAIGRLMLDNVPVVRALLPSDFDLGIQRFAAQVEQARASLNGMAQ